MGIQTTTNARDKLALLTGHRQVRKAIEGKEDRNRKRVQGRHNKAKRAQNRARNGKSKAKKPRWEKRPKKKEEEEETQEPRKVVWIHD